MYVPFVRHFIKNARYQSTLAVPDYAGFLL